MHTQTRLHDEPGFAVAYERATAGATREAFWNDVVSQQMKREPKKKGYKKNETTFPAAANAAMRLALRRASFCMVRSEGAEKEDGKMLPVGGWESRALPAPLPFPISQGSIGVSTTSGEPG